MTAIPAAKAYLVDTLLPAVVPAAQAFYGIPAGYEAPDIICVMDARVEATQPVYGTTRPIEEEGSIDILISCYRAGGTQREATEAAFALHDAIRNHFKTSPNENLGGAVRTAGVTAAELFEDDDPEAIADGRLAQINVTIGFRARN